MLPGVTLHTAAGQVDGDAVAGVSLEIGGEEFLRWILQLPGQRPADDEPADG